MKSSSGSYMNEEGLTSRAARISGGEIEYASVGKGPSVLISHGTLGGFDQAVAISQLFNREKFSFLTVSRAGYLYSSADTGRTPKDQARSYRDLLDHEGISKTAVMGLSGGAPSAIRFARDFADRCWALVLISSITAAPPPLPLFFRLAVRFQDITMRIDPLWSLVYRHGLGFLMRSNGVNASQAEQILADPRLRGIIQGIFLPINSSSLRREGLRLDGRQIEALPVDPNYEINVPTYISHAANDPLASPSAAARLADRIEGAEYLEFADGGHLFFVVHSEKVVPEIERFLAENAPQ